MSATMTDTGTIRVYDLPLSNSSTPVASVPMKTAALYLGVNSTTLAVTRLQQLLDFVLRIAADLGQHLHMNNKLESIPVSRT